MAISGKNMVRKKLRRVNIKGAITNVHIQIVKQKRNFIGQRIGPLNISLTPINIIIIYNPQLSIILSIARVLPIVEQGPHQPYLVGVEVQGDKYSLLVFYFPHQP